MTISERVAWALLISEPWYALWRVCKGKSFSLNCKARGIVVFDRVLTVRTAIDTH